MLNFPLERISQHMPPMVVDKHANINTYQVIIPSYFRFPIWQLKPGVCVGLGPARGRHQDGTHHASKLLGKMGREVAYMGRTVRFWFRAHSVKEEGKKGIWEKSSKDISASSMGLLKLKSLSEFSFPLEKAQSHPVRNPGEAWPWGNEEAHHLFTARLGPCISYTPSRTAARCTLSWLLQAVGFIFNTLLEFL